MTTSSPQPDRTGSPYIPADRKLPEITVKAVVLGVLLSMVLAGANAYLGLKVGMTVSASIPKPLADRGAIEAQSNRYAEASASAYSFQREPSWALIHWSVTRGWARASA